MLKEAMLYETFEDRKVHCYLCHHDCRIPESKFGFCNVRQNIKGTVYTHTYGKAVAANTDPIEKKPLYHFLPGTLSFRLPQQAATSGVRSVKTGKSRRFRKGTHRKSPAGNYHPKILSDKQNKSNAGVSPIPTRNPLSFMSTLMTPQN